MTSTSEVYGTARYTPIDELHPLQGQSPYSASKIAADHLAEAYYRSFDLPVVILRPFNTFGPRQSARAIIPTIISQALKGEKVITLGNLSPKRDLTFVSDTAQAFLLAATAPEIEGEIIHFGQGTAISVRELAQLCLNSIGSKAEINSVTERSRPEKSEVGLLLCNPQKANRLLKWTPQVPLEVGIQKTIEYMRAHAGEYADTGYVV
jgi:dTDP-glucose 4,6-dehydratase